LNGQSDDGRPPRGGRRRLRCGGAARACPRRPLRTLLAAALAAIIGDAAARPFPVPPTAPVATVDVPDDWGPTATTDGVEASAADGAVRLAVQFIHAADAESASAAAIANLSRFGVSPAHGSRRASSRRTNGLEALKVDYSGTDPNGESEITTIVFVMQGGGAFVAVSYWGDDEAQEAVANDLQAIAESLAPAR